MKLHGAYIVLYHNDLCSWLSSSGNNINNGLHLLSLYYRLGTVLINFYTASLSIRDSHEKVILGAVMNSV